MHVLMLAPLPPPFGGISSWTIRYKAYCEEKHIPFDIVNIAVGEKRAVSGENKRSIIEELRRTRRIIGELRSKLSTTKPDIVHINTSCPPMGIIRDLICTRISKSRVYTVVHFRCNLNDKVQGKLSYFALKSMIHIADKVIVLNHFSREYVERIQKGKAVYIPNFIDSKAISDNYVVRQEIKTVVTVGHVQKSKGLQEVIEAANLNEDIIFNWVGEICEDISRYNIPSNMHLLGKMGADGVKKSLDEADVFLFPSKTEGFSNAVLEAMARGVPSIASNVGANYEMLENKGGLVLDECTGETITDAILKIKDLELRVNMSKWNIQKVKSEYVGNVVMRQYFELYSDICKEKNSIQV